MLKRAFITYVRPLVEYNSVVWSPYYKQDVEAIERVQRRFSKRLPGLKELSYEQRLKFLGWPTLKLRRLHTDLIWCYKILFGLVHVNTDHFSNSLQIRLEVMALSYINSFYQQYSVIVFLHSACC